MTRRVPLSAALLVLPVLVAAAWQQPTFRVQVDHVEVTARVTGPGGTFVPDLRQEEFELFEEGRPQAITDFRLVDLPTENRPALPAAWGGAEPDVRSTVEPFDGRVYVLVLDSLHVRPERAADVRQMARRFLERYFVDGDVAAVVNTTGSAGPAHEFTTSRASLLSAIDRFGATVTTLESDEDIVQETIPGGPTTTAQDTLESLGRIAETVGTIKGRRKAIVFFSEGPGYCADMGSQRQSAETGPRADAAPRGEILTPRSVNDPKAWGRGILNAAIQRLVATANRNNVAVYGIDPKRLQAETQDCGSAAAVQSLRDLSDQTAGFAVADTNRLDAGFERLRQENSRYYVLGYYPAERATGGTFRHIEVRTKRRGLDVQARLGYTVAQRAASAPAASPRAGEASQALRDAMDSVLPVAALRVAASAAVFRGEQDAATAMLSVVVDGRDITFRQGDGSAAGALEMAWATMNSRGERGSAQSELVQLPLDEKSRAGIVASGLRVVRSLPVPPGRHQLRIGVVDRPTGRAGVVHLDLVVPDFKRAGFAMSGVLVSSSLAGKVPTARGGPLDLLQRVLPGPPAQGREFRAGEDLALYAEVYGTAAAGPGTAVSVAVLDERGSDTGVKDTPSSVPGAAEASRVEFRRIVPLKGLAPGRYLLRLEARPGSSRFSPAIRSVPFSVLP